MKTIIIVAAGVLGLTLLFLMYDAWKDFTCGAGFKGIETNWSPIAGCTVETKAGVWIPRQNYRSE